MVKINIFSMIESVEFTLEDLAKDAVSGVRNICAPLSKSHRPCPPPIFQSPRRIMESGRAVPRVKQDIERPAPATGTSAPPLPPNTVVTHSISVRSGVRSGGASAPQLSGLPRSANPPRPRLPSSRS